MPTPRLRLLLTTLSLLAARSAHACTVCDSANGKALRAGLFNGHFLHTLLLVLAPAPVLALGALLLHRLMPDLVVDDPATCIASVEATA